MAGDQVASMEGDVRRDEETSGTRSGYGSEVDPDGRIPAVKFLNLETGLSNIGSFKLELAA